ncbi:MAG: hypothetical protein P8Y44_05680, partial [Acidobacteriota bacterium]
VFAAAHEAPGPRSAAHGVGDARPGAKGRPDDDQALDAATVLDALIDARLLTAYEEPAQDDEGEPQQRIEIIHESLLNNWPRLVRWRTQDADSAQLKDQLRQAAQMWIERGRPEDLLWTGTSYKEYELWRERYEGGLSESEETFAGAMKSKAERRKRQRRIVVTGAFALLMAILAVVGVSRQQAVRAARIAEAQKLLALGEVELEEWSTVALAHASASLELADSAEARMFALRALSQGPPARVLPTGPGAAGEVFFSPDGAWMAFRGSERLQVVSRDGQITRALEPFSGRRSVFGDFDPTRRYLFGAKGSELRVWSVPEFRLRESQTLPDGRTWAVRATERGVFTITVVGEEQVVMQTEPGRQPWEVGRLETTGLPPQIDRAGEWLLYVSEGTLLAQSLQQWNLPPRRLGSSESDFRPYTKMDETGTYVATKVGRKPLTIFIWPKFLRPRSDGKTHCFGGPDPGMAADHRLGATLPRGRRCDGVLRHFAAGR